MQTAIANIAKATKNALLNAVEAHSCADESLALNFLSKAQLLNSISGCFYLKIFVNCLKEPVSS